MKYKKVNKIDPKSGNFVSIGIDNLIRFEYSSLFLGFCLHNLFITVCYSKL